MLPGSQSMRANYAGGVDVYYSGQASTTYRNPHDMGIKRTLATYMDLYCNAAEAHQAAAGREHGGAQSPLQILDMAAGSGEVTEALASWRGKRKQRQAAAAEVRATPSVPSLNIIATDPYTAPAYAARTGMVCHLLSFSDLAAGTFPPGSPPVFDLIICSFALHLLTDPSQLWALLSVLSERGRLLVVLAPHKKPDIKENWGWERLDPWNLAEKESEDVQGGAGQSLKREMGGKRGDGYEIYEERVRLRVWKSTAFSSIFPGEETEGGYHEGG